MDALTDPLVWVDLEMTGLDPAEHVIVEIAVIITDGALETLVEGPDLIIHATDEQLGRMDDFVTKMHKGSGLTEAVRASTLTVAEAEEQVMAFIKEHVPEHRVGLLAGNSIHTDRTFLTRYMPAITDHLHYRLVDVSTVKELARRWYPDDIEDAPIKGGAHRALADIRESIDELRWFRDRVFR
ncbi:MAG: oligoribonuclease [Acidimicrobiia bacterium]|nr:oligoribonuclease [Acidimicrobiia bacterium]